MPDFNIDDALSSFGEKSKATPKSNFDIDSILTEFGVKANEPIKLPRVVIDTTPKPPISGYSKETSDELNQTKIDKIGGENPRRSLPTTNIEESINNAFRSGKETFSEGLSDIASNKPASGVGKVAMGALGVSTAPISGLVEGAISTPISDITGNKNIGDKAGLVVNSAIPIVPTGSAVVKALPKNKALSTLVQNIGEENLPAVVSAMKANPRLTPADLSPRVLQDTQHLFANEGPQIDYLAKTSAERMATRKGTIEAAYDASGGTPVNVVEKLNDLATASKKVGNEKINPAVTGAGPVDLTKTIDEINKVLKPGVMSVVSGESSLPLTAVKKELANIKAHLANDKEMRTSAADLHNFQAGLRRTAETLKKSANGGERQLGEALMNVRNNLVSDIDKASGGKYKPALSNYRDEMHIADSFRDGYEGVFSNSKKMENRPEFTEAWFKGLTDAEKEAAREGARTAIGTEIGVAKNGALAGESLVRSDFNKAKLEILFGKEEANKLVKALEDERTIANTHNKIVEGSQTAMRTASKSQFALPDKTEVLKSAPAVAATEAANYFMGGYPTMGAGVLAVAKAGAITKDAIKMKLAREHNAQYAKYALPTEGPSRDELIRQLEARIPGPKQSLITRGASSLARLVSP